MAQYILINGASIPFSTPNTIVPPSTDGPIPPIAIAPQQTFQITVQGNGAVSATVQPIVSNDRINWSPYGDPVLVAGVTRATAGFGGSQNWQFYSAYLTAITGLQARATLVMNG